MGKWGMIEGLVGELRSISPTSIGAFCDSYTIWRSWSASPLDAARDNLPRPTGRWAKLGVLEGAPAQSRL